MKNKNLIFILFFCATTWAQDSFFLQFNKSVDFVESKKYKEAIELLNKLEKNTGGLSTKEKSQFFYQLGTIYCHIKQYSPCAEKLKKAFKLDGENFQIKKNLELAYLMKKNNNNKNEKKDKQDKKKDKQKQQNKFGQQYKTQIKQVQEAEKRVFKKLYQQKIKKIKKQRNFDW